jgi:hypothetical protein
VLHGARKRGGALADRQYTPLLFSVVATASTEYPCTALICAEILCVCVAWAVCTDNDFTSAAHHGSFRSEIKAPTARTALKSPDGWNLIMPLAPTMKSLSMSTELLFDSENKAPTERVTHHAFAYGKNRAAD